MKTEDIARGDARHGDRVLSNPNCEIVGNDPGLLDTDAAVGWLRARGAKCTSANLAVRRMTGRAPRFLKFGTQIRYRETDLREFLKMCGIHERRK